MFEVSCAGCQASIEFSQDDYIHLCPLCSTGFILDTEEGAKDIIGDHYCVPPIINQDDVKDIFSEWISTRYHNRKGIKKEIFMMGSYGVMLPYWVISLDAHTYWSGYSLKAKDYPGQSAELAHKFVSEEGRFSKRYRWAVLARKSPKEHWGLERLHHPREPVAVDWDGFPLDETMGQHDENQKPVYEAKVPFKFENANGMSVSGIQTKEAHAINRARDQVTEYHRRIAKSRIGSLYEYKTELEVIGIHVVHMPFWIVRYAYAPKSLFRFFSPVREKRVLIQAYTGSILDAELPLQSADKMIINGVFCGLMAFLSLTFSIFLHPLFYLLFILFAGVTMASTIKLVRRETLDSDLIKGPANVEGESL